MRSYISLFLPEALKHLSMVRRVSREMLDSFGVSLQDIDDIESLVGELTTNAARHARSSFYRVEVELSETQAVVTVSDHGIGFQRSLLPGPEGRYRGWGLPLVERLADRVEFLPSLPHGVIVRAEKLLRPMPR